jgi:hypothetical protein
MHIIPAILLAVLAGPLLAAASAKAFLPAARLDWPLESLPVPVGPRAAAAAELAVAVVLITAPVRAAAITGAVCYAVLTAVAWRLRGQRCACFGLARLASVGPAHLALNSAATVVAVAVAVTGGGAGTVIRPGIAVAATAVTGGLLAVTGRGREVRQPCQEQIGGVRLYVSESCPACRALQTLLAGVEPARRAAVQILDRQESPPPAEAARLGVPCAVPISITGQAACTPVSGVDPVWRLIQGITITVGQPR